MFIIIINVVLLYSFTIDFILLYIYSLSLSFFLSQSSISVAFIYSKS